MTSQPDVLISGGGPVGLFCALLLGRQGLRVRVFDINDGPQDDPRAATTHPATLELLGQAGLVEDMARVGLVAPIFQFWDRPSGRKVAEFDNAALADEVTYPFVIQCEQFKTAQLIIERLRTMGNVELMYGHEVVGVSQTADAASVTVRGADGDTTHSAAWLIGADGARSVVRKQLAIPFEGFTWEERFIVLTTPFDFGERGYCSRSYFADPAEWCNCFKVSADGPPGLWRAVFPTDPKATVDELMSDDAVQARMQRFFPADEPYDIVHRNLYTLHQRVADKFRVGRVLLAGDAAHINNPIGGMGLNGGLQDAANLAEKLVRVALGGETDRLLDLYHLQRWTVATEFVQQQSIANKRSLEESDPVKRELYLAELAETAADPARAKQFMMRAGMVLSQRRAAAMTLPETVF